MTVMLEGHVIRAEAALLIVLIFSALTPISLRAGSEELKEKAAESQATETTVQEVRAELREALKADRPEFLEIRENFRDALPELLEQLKDHTRKLREEQRHLKSESRCRTREK